MLHSLTTYRLCPVYRKADIQSIQTKRLIPMYFLSEKYLRICDAEFKKTLALGAAGILFDECLHHSPALLCFDTSRGHRYAARSMPTTGN